MSYVYAGVETYHGSVVLPSDGDPAVAASVDVSLEDLMDNSLVFRADIAHQAFDDRGKTSTITGDIVLNDGGGSVDFELPVTFGAAVDVNAEILIHTGGALTSFGPVDIRNDSTIGSTGTDQCNVYARIDHYGASVFHENVTITTGDQLTVHGTVVIDGESTAIQSQINQIGLDDDSVTSVAGTLAVTGSVTIRDDIRVLGNATLGNSSTDDHTINGHVGLEGDLHVVQSLTVDDGAEISNGLDVHGSAEFFSDLQVNGDTTIGSNSSDTITTNALLATPLGLSGAGRVLSRITLLPNLNTALDPADADIFRAPSTITAGRIYSVSSGTGGVGQAGDSVVVLGSGFAGNDCIVQVSTGGSVTLTGGATPRAWVELFCIVPGSVPLWEFMRGNYI